MFEPVPASPNTTTVSRVEPRIVIGPELIGPPAVVDGTALNATNALLNTERTSAQKTRGDVPPGLVVCDPASGTKLVEATDPTRKTFGAAVITSLIAGSAAWDGKIVKLFENDTQVASVTLGGSDDSTSKIVTALNGNATFASFATASGADGAALVITSIKKGPRYSLKVGVNLTTAYAKLDAAGTGSEKSACGTGPVFRVMGDLSLTKDSDGSTIDAGAGRNYVGGCFLKSRLVGLTGEAEAHMRQQGFVLV